MVVNAMKKSPLHPSKGSLPRWRKPRLERLENRMAPAALVVNSALDPAALTVGTLRYAVNQANMDAAASISDEILFDTASMGTNTITLTQGALELTAGTGMTTIDGGGQVTVSGNNAGTVFQVDSQAQALFTALTIENGNAGSQRGGGIDNAGLLTVSNVNFVGNSAGSGGAIENSGSLTVLNSTFSANLSSRNGGGAIDNTGKLTVSSSAFTANTNSAITNESVMTISNTTLSGNYGGVVAGLTGDGGGIVNAGILTVVNSTITGNSAADGGGIANTGMLLLMNTIVAGNSISSTGFDPDIDGAVVAASAHNLIGHDAGLSGIANGDANGNLVGTSDNPIDPLLGSFGSYGGATQSVPLLTGSPAMAVGGAITVLTAAVTDAATTTITVQNAATIASTPGEYLIRIDGEEMLVTNVNRATNTLTVVRGQNGTTATAHAAGAAVYLATDQRGLPRPAAPDIGAFQTQPQTLTLRPAALPGPTVGQTYSTLVGATGGSGDYEFALASGTLPTGLALDTAGELSGTPAVTGTFGFILLATDALDPSLNGSLSYTLTVSGHDTLATAIPLPTKANQQAQVAGYTGSVNQVDLYAVAVQADEALVVDVTDPAVGNPQSSLRIFDSTGRTVASQPNSGSLVTTLSFGARVAGLYYVGVSSGENLYYDPTTTDSGNNGAATGTYILSVSLVPFQIHDTLATAIPLPTNANHQAQAAGSITHANEVNLYAVTVQADETLAVDVTDQAIGSPASSLRILDSSGQTVASVTNSGKLDTLLSFGALAGGTYYVGVSSGENLYYNPTITGSGSNGAATGTYTLSVSLEAFQIHDSLTAAIPVTLNEDQQTQLAGALAYANQVNLYAVSLESGDQLSADIAGRVAGTLAAGLRIFDQDGRQLALQENTASPDTTQSFVAASAGRYYVGVSSNHDVSYDPNTTNSGRGGLSSRTLHPDARPHLGPGGGKHVERPRDERLAGLCSADHYQYDPPGNLQRRQRILQLHGQRHRRLDGLGDTGGRGSFRAAPESLRRRGATADRVGCAFPERRGTADPAPGAGHVLSGRLRRHGFGQPAG